MVEYRSATIKVSGFSSTKVKLYIDGKGVTQAQPLTCSAIALFAVFRYTKGMQFDALLNCVAMSLLASLLISGPIRSQENTASSVATFSNYTDTAAGLQHLLEAMLEAAKSNDFQKLTRFVKGTEVPNCDSWLHNMYESDKADSWMGLCESKFLGPNEKSFMDLFSKLAQEDGQVVVRKVNDNPEPGRGMEWGWLQAIKQPLDIYFASWKDGRDPKGEPIGYFMFVDEGFRWDSLIQFPKVQISNFKFVPPRLVKKVDPLYPPEAAAHHISGIVRIYFVIGADGIVYNAHAISGDGLSDDQSLRKAAEDAVIQWRYTPATVDGKPAESNAMTVDLTFSRGN